METPWAVSQVFMLISPKYIKENVAQDLHCDKSCLIHFSLNWINAKVLMSLPLRDPCSTRICIWDVPILGFLSYAVEFLKYIWQNACNNCNWFRRNQSPILQMLIILRRNSFLSGTCPPTCQANRLRHTEYWWDGTNYLLLLLVHCIKNWLAAFVTKKVDNPEPGGEIDL